MDANPGLRVARTARIGSTPGWFSVKGTSKARRKKEHSRDGSGTWESGACCRCVAMSEWMNVGSFTLLIWFFIPFLLASRVFTIPEFLEKRFTPALRQVFAIVTIVSILAAVLYGGALAIQRLFHGELARLVYFLFGPSAAADAAARTQWEFWIALVALALVAGVWAIYGRRCERNMLSDGPGIVQNAAPFQFGSGGCHHGAPMSSPHSMSDACGGFVCAAVRGRSVEHRLRPQYGRGRLHSFGTGAKHVAIAVLRPRVWCFGRTARHGMTATPILRNSSQALRKRCWTGLFYSPRMRRMAAASAPAGCRDRVSLHALPFHTRRSPTSSSWP